MISKAPQKPWANKTAIYLQFNKALYSEQDLHSNYYGSLYKSNTSSLSLITTTTIQSIIRMLQSPVCTRSRVGASQATANTASRRAITKGRGFNGCLKRAAPPLLPPVTVVRAHNTDPLTQSPGNNQQPTTSSSRRQLKTQNHLAWPPHH